MAKAGGCICRRAGNGIAVLAKYKEEKIGERTREPVRAFGLTRHDNLIIKAVQPCVGSMREERMKTICVRVQYKYGTVLLYYTGC